MAGTAGSEAVGFYSDALSLVGQAVNVFTSHRGEFTITLVIAIALAAVGWVVASNYSRLWNLRFRTTFGHHILCLLAALCTLVFVLLFASLKYTKQAAEIAIDRWQDRLTHDEAWSYETCKLAYYEVKKLGPELFNSEKSRLDDRQRYCYISSSHPQMVKKSAEIHANAAVRNFQIRHPFLSKILWASADIPAKSIDRKMTEFFQRNRGKDFNLQEAVTLAGEEIRSGLQTQTPRVVTVARTVLVVLFLVVQLIPFGIIGYAAYKDLKVTT
jgi:hypothetical protein